MAQSWLWCSQIAVKKLKNAVTVFSLFSIESNHQILLKYVFLREKFVFSTKYHGETLIKPLKIAIFILSKIRLMKKHNLIGSTHNDQGQNKNLTY